VINYIDRQTLSILAPYLKQEYHWTNTDYAASRLHFASPIPLDKPFCGRQMDRVGTRRGLTISVLWYSTVSLLTSLANACPVFAAFRFFAGSGRVRQLAGSEQSCFGVVSQTRAGTGRGILRQRIVGRRRDRAFSDFAVYLRWGWRVAFVIPGVLGFFVAHRLAAILLPAAGASAHQRRRPR